MDLRTVRAKVKKPTTRQLKAAELLAIPDKTIQSAMLEAGYSESTAKGGLQFVPKVVFALMAKDAPLMELGRMDAQTQESLVRGRLAFNTIKGRDGGVQSAYRLGMDKRVAMFQPESQVGVIVVNAPNQPDKLLQGMELEQERDV